jgi:bifunctional UDP-N-acetylglucosamine pyrophosphorylase / glucosamine-1-phosphate N-acetyltransferase
MGVSRPLHVIILAAGKGSRMQSRLPKVLNQLGGVPLLERVIRTADALGAAAIHVVHGHRGDEIRSALQSLQTRSLLHWVEQRQQHGTGHAVLTALPAVSADADVLVLLGDVPLVRADTLRQLLMQAEAGDGLALLSAFVPCPQGYGRILRQPPPERPLSGQADGICVGIVEEADATPAQRAIREVNSGILAAPAAMLTELLVRCGRDNVQHEIYLTDVIRLAADVGLRTVVVPATCAEEVAGINTLRQLVDCERWYQRDQAERLIDAGVRLADPQRFDLRGELIAGRDVTIDINCVFEGRVVLGDGCRIGPGCLLKDCELGADVHVLAYSHLDGVSAAAQVRIGPYARLRPATRLGQGCRVGNFVELKKAELGARSKVNHLSYVGDARIGCDVNVGAGTITCNYDGTHKHVTEIGDGAFVGSNTELVAPVRLGAGCVVAAGTTVTADAEPGSLVISRVTQQTIPGWNRRRSGAGTDE